MLLEYPCAMQRKNHYWRREGDLYKYVVTVAIVFFIFTDIISAAPTFDNSLPQSHSSAIAEYFSEINGCYYNFQRYEEGDRIVTNEPCLNCTCHNRMLMCYLRVCPFSKAIGQDCTIEKKPDQCCPIITCPEVPVTLLTSSTTSSPAPITSTTEIGFRDNYGCTINNAFYADGAQVPSDVNKPCELCYCIRNRTACVMQECTLHVEGCKPVFKPGVCCPVRYECDYDRESTSTARLESTIGGLIKSTTPSAPVDCQYNNQIFSDGEHIKTDKPCEHCYCMRGDIVCAVQDCGEPLRGKDCIPTTPLPNKCCPSSYACANETTTIEEITKASDLADTTLFQSENVYSSETTTRYKNTPTVLSQEEVYERLGEKKSSTTLGPEKYTSTPSTPSTGHPSEDIQLDDNSVDADEHGSHLTTNEPLKELSITTSTYEKPSSEKPANEKSSIENEEGQPITNFQSDENVTPILAVSKSSPDDSNEQYDATTIISSASFVENTSKSEFTKAPNAGAEDNLHLATEVTTERIKYETTKFNEKYETTKYNEREKEPNEKLSTNAVNSSLEQDATEAATAEISDQTTPLSVPYSKIPDKIEKQPISEAQPDENSSEANKFQSTTRQFDKSTVIVKEQETTKAPEENLQITTLRQSSYTDASVESDKEQQTETINTLSNGSTDSLLANITKIVNSLQNSQKYPPFQEPVVETTKTPVTESVTTVKSDLYPATEKTADLTTIRDDVAIVVPSVIPGEGSCLVDGITYPNTSVIESSNPCHEKCICLSSIPTCTLVTCAPPPNHTNCMPIQMKQESCCPVYYCDPNEERPSVQIPSSHNQIMPDEPEPPHDLFDTDETTIVNGYEFTTKATDYGKPAETITEKSKPESEVESKPEITTILANKIANEVTEGQKVEYVVTESSSKVSIASETLKPESPTTVPPQVIHEKIDELTTLNEIVDGPTTQKETIVEEIVTESVNKSESEDLHKATTLKELPNEGSSSTETPTTTAIVNEKTEKTSPPYHDDNASENEVHVDDNGAVSDDTYTTVVQETVSEHSPVTKQTTEKYAEVTHSEEPQYSEKETESAEKVITTESSAQFNNPIPPSTESKEEIQKYSTEVPSSPEPSPTVYIDEKIDINPTTLPSKLSDEQNDAGTEYSISSSTPTNYDYSQNPEESVTTTEVPIAESPSTTDSPYSSTPIVEINTEVPDEQSTKGYETYSSTEIPTISEHNKQEAEYVTTIKADLDNEVSQPETTPVVALNENNAVNSESTPVADTSYSIANEYTSEFYSSSYPTTEKGLELDVTERISNVPEVEQPTVLPNVQEQPSVSTELHEQPAGSFSTPTTTVESETVILNEQYNPIAETTESANANEAYQPSSSPQYTTVPDLEDEKHTGSGYLVTNEPSNAVTINPAYEEVIKEHEVKPITVFPETNDYPSVTVLPSKTTYPTLPPIFLPEGLQTESTPEDHSSVSPSSQPDELQTRIPETNEIHQQPDSGSQKVETPTTEHTEPHPTDVPPQEPSYPPTEKEAPIISSFTSTQSMLNETSSAVTHPAVQQSTWTRKPYDEETSEPNYYPPVPMYPTGGGESAPESGSEESEYEDSSAFGPGTCRYGGKIYVSAQQIPRDDPCDFCFCFRSDIICLQQSCPPPIQGCRQEPIQGFCCPRYECPVATALVYNSTTTSTTTSTSTTTTLPPHFPLESYRGHARRVGCMIHGYFYKVGEDIAIASGPCLECICGSDGRMKCDPKSCSPEPFVRSFMGEAASKR